MESESREGKKSIEDLTTDSTDNPQKHSPVIKDVYEMLQKGPATQPELDRKLPQGGLYSCEPSHHGAYISHAINVLMANNHIQMDQDGSYSVIPGQ